MHATATPVDTEIESAEHTDTAQNVDLSEMPSLDGGDAPRCECDHGTETEYIPCGRRARWRVSIDCQCGEGHPRAVEILCSRCLRTLRRNNDREAITARRL
ncbi:hypothetical protein PTQ19_01385 [Microbacterium esteraromaticum]|uniref:hypothetical protein n=1 Tax=Microbacterium esteraromaticum TaxID=57043 RepID=UPI0023685036|nr:hypothetical protein [Microbacterium esteraromaticum]WDH79124.1 hypothetical protein PTQ19_01385 [Microbacterium esteraromaticum]